jgi:phospholipid/cholesterol/gamma-HCH transport system ATP-binding protein
VTEKPPVVRAEHIRKIFGDRTVLDDISFEVHRGEIFVIMGPSGCGKSTLLKILIGALEPDGGRVLMDGEAWDELRGRSRNRLRRKFGILFQDAALLNSLTVAENVALPIRYHTRHARATIDIMVKMKLELVGLRHAANLIPAELSGGMRKRAGLARALALDPMLVFCDEPSSGLDPVASAVIDDLLLELRSKLNISFVVVTHDVESAFRIADRIVVLEGGRVLALGRPDEIRGSEDPAVRQFIERRSEGPISVHRVHTDLLTDLLGG